MVERNSIIGTCRAGLATTYESFYGANLRSIHIRWLLLCKECFDIGVHLLDNLVFVVAEQLAGKEPSVNLDVVPGCVYTDPEIASAGITEDAAKEQGIKVKTGKFIMSANGKSLITKEERGFIKIVADEETDVILGAQMMCARATDMIGEFVTAIANKMTVAQLLKGMRAHPTYNEGIGEALEEAEGGAIHVVPKKKK